MSSEYKSENEYIQAQLPQRKPPTQEVRHNPRWDKRMKHIIKLKRRGLL